MTFDSCIKGDTLVLDYLKDTSGAVTFLSRKPYIKKLSLRFCSIGTKGVEALAGVNLTNLTSLDLGCNNIW
ncbi:hypothetical protein [Wolbachia endosymbiont of Cardiocondyla obscurior]|uniref:hypothetical protein n=1 Tax=Wolbachia endosymbiont of Cardiocondyla obscurior TaxID=2687307 RepID=UPI00157BA795